MNLKDFILTFSFSVNHTSSVFAIHH
ncbi:AlpA family transcriptional regulator, partial [Escherichia coli]